MAILKPPSRCAKRAVRGARRSSPRACREPPRSDGEWLVSRGRGDLLIGDAAAVSQRPGREEVSAAWPRRLAGQ